MGLSDKERHEKILWSVHRLTLLGKEIDVKDTTINYNCRDAYIGIQNEIATMWPILLSGKGNSAFWLLGSNYSIEADSSTMWSIVMYDKIKNAGKTDEWGDIIEQRRTKDKKQYIYDCISNHLEIESLLHGQHKIIYKISEWLENIMYAANRYQDVLSEQYYRLTECVAMCKGHIFHIWTEEDQYPKAWLVNEISKLLLKNTAWVEIEKADDIQRLVHNHNIHHTIAGMQRESIEYLREILKRLTVDNSDKNRLQVLLDIIAGKEILIPKKKTDILATCKKYRIKWIPVEVKKDNESLSNYQESREWYRKDLLGIK